MKKVLTFLLAVLGLNTACSQNFDNYDVKAFAELTADPDVVILDVRKADEFAEGHIAGAILIDQFQSDFAEQVKAKLPKDKVIAIYCRSGRRSANLTFGTSGCLQQQSGESEDTCQQPSRARQKL